jgi:hypothetical protein
MNHNSQFIALCLFGIDSEGRRGQKPDVQSDELIGYILRSGDDFLTHVTHSTPDRPYAMGKVDQTYPAVPAMKQDHFFYFLVRILYGLHQMQKNGKSKARNLAIHFSLYLSFKQTPL